MSGTALLPAPAPKLWPNFVLRVYFINKQEIPAVRYDDEFITTDKIIGWMNEWSKGSRTVPKFMKTEIIAESDVRIKFDVKGTYTVLVVHGNDH